MAIFIFVLLGAVGLGTLGYLAETKKQILGKTYEFDIYGIPHKVLSSSSVQESAQHSVPVKHSWTNGWKKVMDWNRRYDLKSRASRTLRRTKGIQYPI